MAGILGVMSMGRPDIFVGTGPYRYVSQDANSVHLEAFPGYHGGMPATKYVDFVRAKADGSDVVAGTVDILSDAFPGVPFGRLSLGAAFEATAEAHGIHVLHLPGSNYAQLIFNVREGRLFSDVDLRRALQLCIDLPRDVDAATGGTGIPIYSPVMPGSWADDPDLPKPDRDVAAGKRLIEASGWTLGADGVYAKGKLRLAARIIVRGGMADRVKMVDLIAAQARDCGMDLESLLVDDYGDLFTYPHDIPGTKTPFDLLLIVYGTGVGPADSLQWYTSSVVSDEEHPDGGNMGGFSDPAFDRLLAEAGATYDQADQVRLYRQAQEELAAQLPALFLWNQALTDAVRPTVATVDGPARPHAAQLGLAAGAAGGRGRSPRRSGALPEEARGLLLPPVVEARRIAVVADRPRRDLLALVRPEDPGAAVLRVAGELAGEGDAQRPAADARARAGRARIRHGRGIAFDERQILPGRDAVHRRRHEARRRERVVPDGVGAEHGRRPERQVAAEARRAAAERSVRQARAAAERLELARDPREELLLGRGQARDTGRSRRHRGRLRGRGRGRRGRRHAGRRRTGSPAGRDGG